MGAIVMDGAVVESGAMVAAGALVAPGKRVPAGATIVGLAEVCLTTKQKTCYRGSRGGNTEANVSNPTSYAEKGAKERG